MTSLFIKKSKFFQKKSVVVVHSREFMICGILKQVQWFLKLKCTLMELVRIYTVDRLKATKLQNIQCYFPNFSWSLQFQIPSKIREIRAILGIFLEYFCTLRLTSNIIPPVCASLVGWKLSQSYFSKNLLSLDMVSVFL